jgi:hypothetical protein
LPLKSREAGDQPALNRITDGDHDDRNAAGRPHGSEGPRRGPRDDDVDLRADEIGGKAVQSAEPFGGGHRSQFEGEVLSRHVPEFSQSLPECLDGRVAAVAGAARRTPIR